MGGNGFAQILCDTGPCVTGAFGTEITLCPRFFFFVDSLGYTTGGWPVGRRSWGSGTTGDTCRGRRDQVEEGLAIAAGPNTPSTNDIHLTGLPLHSSLLSASYVPFIATPLSIDFKTPA